MLVLSRKPEESVVVGGSDRFERMLKVTGLEIIGGKVRLGFEADADVPVHRTEVWERIVATSRLGGSSGGRAPPVAWWRLLDNAPGEPFRSSEASYFKRMWKRLPAPFSKLRNPDAGCRRS
jgi:carbon storage regulator CsrA